MSKINNIILIFNIIRNKKCPSLRHYLVLYWTLSTKKKKKTLLEKYICAIGLLPQNLIVNSPMWQLALFLPAHSLTLYSYMFVNCKLQRGNAVFVCYLCHCRFCIILIVDLSESGWDAEVMSSLKVPPPDGGGAFDPMQRPQAPVRT